MVLVTDRAPDPGLRYNWGMITTLLRQLSLLTWLTLGLAVVVMHPISWALFGVTLLALCATLLVSLFSA